MKDTDISSNKSEIQRLALVIFLGSALVSATLLLHATLLIMTSR